MGLKLTHVGLLGELANHYITRGAQVTVLIIAVNWVLLITMSYVTFSYGPLHIGVPVLVDEQERTNNIPARIQDAVYRT